MGKFDDLYKVNVSDKTEKKGNLTYLSWCWAWAEFKKVYPDANYEVKKFNGLPYVHDEKTGYMVYTSVTAEGVTYEMWLPVMDARNKTLKNAEMFDINKTIMRCLTKNLAMFGLGLYIYAGEDLPEDEQKAPREGTSAAKKAQAVAKAEEFKRLTKSELVQVYGVSNAEATIAWFEKKFGIAFQDWDKKATEAARAKLTEQKEKQERGKAEKWKAEADGVEAPFPMED